MRHWYSILVSVLVFTKISTFTQAQAQEQEGENSETPLKLLGGGCCRTQGDGFGDYDEHLQWTCEQCWNECQRIGASCVGFEFNPVDQNKCEIHLTALTHADHDAFACSESICFHRLENASNFNWNDVAVAYEKCGMATVTSTTQTATTTNSKTSTTLTQTATTTNPKTSTTLSTSTTATLSTTTLSTAPSLSTSDTKTSSTDGGLKTVILNISTRTITFSTQQPSSQLITNSQSVASGPTSSLSTSAKLVDASESSPTHPTDRTTGSHAITKNPGSTKTSHTSLTTVPESDLTTHSTTTSILQDDGNDDDTWVKKASTFPWWMYLAAFLLLVVVLSALFYGLRRRSQQRMGQVRERRKSSEPIVIYRTHQNNLHDSLCPYEASTEFEEPGVLGEIKIIGRPIVPNRSNQHHNNMQPNSNNSSGSTPPPPIPSRFRLPGVTSSSNNSSSSSSTTQKYNTYDQFRVTQRSDGYDEIRRKSPVYELPEATNTKDNNTAILFRCPSDQLPSVPSTMRVSFASGNTRSSATQTAVSHYEYGEAFFGVPTYCSLASRDVHLAESPGPNPESPYWRAMQQ